MNNLCCLMHPHVLCEGCNARYCMDCYGQRDKEHPEFNMPGGWEQHVPEVSTGVRVDKFSAIFCSSSKMYVYFNPDSPLSHYTDRAEWVLLKEKPLP